MTGMTSERPLMTLPRACIVFALVLLCAVQVPLAQSRPPAAATPADAALKALNAGQYDEVERLLRSATDARSVAIRARADIERGRYAEAEKTADAGRECSAGQRRGARARSAADATRPAQRRGAHPEADRRARGRADRCRAPASRSGGARARRVSGRERVLPSGQSPGADRRRGEHRRGASCSSRSTTARKRCDRSRTR